MYISVAEASEKWGVSHRQVQRLLTLGKIPHSKKYGRSWMIPEDAEKPADRRRKKELPQKSLSADLNYIFAHISMGDMRYYPGEIFDYEGGYAYLQGDFELAKRCFLKIEEDDAAKLSACSLAIATAISLGDYAFYMEIETYLKGIVEAGLGANVSALAESALATAYVSAHAPQMVPGWLKEGDFAALQPHWKPDAVYKRAKYFQCLGQYESCLAVAQTALVFCHTGRVSFDGIYLRLMCAVACHHLERADEAKRYLLDTMNICLPHGFITPFAEMLPVFDGLMEQCLEQAFPSYRDAVIRQWERTFANWVTYHNQFTADNIPLILSLREIELASLVARRIPYEKIAKRHSISVGRLKNIMTVIYDKLLISNRSELSKYIMHYIK